jgi:L-ribulose-5-phosphate 3-epimerase
MKKGMYWGGLPEGLTVADRLELAAKAGFDGVEPRVMDAGSDGLVRYDSTSGDLRTVSKMITDAGLAICSVMNGGAHILPYPIVDDDPAVRAKGIGTVRRMIEITADLGAGSLLLVPHWVGDRVPYDLCYERTLDALRQLGPIAQAAGVCLAVENVWNKFLLSPIEFARLIDDSGSPAVRAYFDVGNILIAGYPQHWIRILGSRIARVHVKDFTTSIGNGTGFAQLLHGDVNWPAVRQALRDIGYDGWMTAEVGLLKHFQAESVYDTATAMDRIIAL